MYLPSFHQKYDIYNNGDNILGCVESMNEGKKL